MLEKMTEAMMNQISGGTNAAVNFDDQHMKDDKQYFFLHKKTMGSIYMKYSDFKDARDKGELKEISRQFDDSDSEWDAFG